ncbi:MAG TPA: LapA family protein [Acidimicrobiales bacterium]
MAKEDRRWVGESRKGTLVPGEGPAGGGFRVTPKLVLIVVLVILLVLFIAQNREKVNFDLAFFHFQTGLWLILAVTAGLGVLVGFFLGRGRYKD